MNVYSILRYNRNAEAYEFEIRTIEFKKISQKQHTNHAIY
jgi:hypothetical protein